MVHRLKRIVDEKAGKPKFNQAFDFLSPYLTRSGAVYTGVGNGDAERLAPVLGVPAEDLYPPTDPYTTSKTGKYWMSFSIKVGNDDVRLDTSDPYQELQYLFLKNHHYVANGESAKSAKHLYVLVDEEHEAKVQVTKGQMRAKAYAFFSKMTSDEMRSCLRAMGQGVDSIGSQIRVEAAMTKMIDKTPVRFMEMWVNNKERLDLSWIVDCIHVNLLRKTDDKYFYGQELIAMSTTEMGQWKRDPKNSVTVATMTKELEAKKKMK